MSRRYRNFFFSFLSVRATRIPRFISYSGCRFVLISVRIMLHRRRETDRQGETNIQWDQNEVLFRIISSKCPRHETPKALDQRAGSRYPSVETGESRGVDSHERLKEFNFAGATLPYLSSRPFPAEDERLRTTSTKLQVNKF